MATRDDVIVLIQSNLAEQGVEGTSKKDAGVAMDAVLKAIGEAAMADVGGSGLRTVLGTFRRKETNDRVGHNPQTGEPVDIKGRVSVAFKPAGIFNVLKEETAKPAKKAAPAKAAAKPAAKAPAKKVPAKRK